MKSVLKLYKDSLIIEGRNFVVDDIEDYLATLTNTLSFNDFQYIKHALEITIKIDKDQSYLDFTSANDYNYCSIQNMNANGSSPQKTVYYFVYKLEWGASSTIRLHLVMDTINTFRITTDFTISARTTILREHKDRYRELPAETFTKNYSTFCYCDSQFMGDYVGTAIIQTGGSSVTINSITSNALSITPVIAGGKITLNVVHYNPNERIDITVNATVVMPKTYQRIIDPVSEGIQGLLFKKSSVDITDNNNLKWFLIYKNLNAVDPTEVNPVNPIIVELRASEQIVVKQYSYFTIETADLNDNDYILITAVMNDLLPVPSSQGATNQHAITVDGYLAGDFQFKNYIRTEIDDNGLITYGTVIYKKSGTMYMANAWFTNSGSGYIDAPVLAWVKAVDSIDIDSNALLGSSLKYYKGTFVNDSDMLQYKGTPNVTQALSLAGPWSIPPIYALDRSDSKLIKIIECPYCPSGLSMNGNNYVIGKGWEVTQDGLLDVVTLKDINSDLINNIDTDIESPIKELYAKSLTISTSASRDDDNESKLFHSDYFQNKIVYDSFNYMIALENLDIDNAIFNKAVPDLFKIDWVTANTINSRFLAIFPQLKYARSVQDFDNVLYINRNNELPIFNSTYLNYLRAGYNYDVKQKNAAIEKANDDLMLSIITGAAKIGAGVVTGAIFGNVGGAIAGGVTAAIGVAASTYQQYHNAAYSIARQEDSIAQKLVQSRAAATSVSAADDVNLLNQYCSLPKCMKYTVGENFKKAIADLFYYCGYKRDIQGSPNFTSRYWFNFVAAELVIATTNNIPADIMNDIVAKFKDGVTVLHHHTTWNFSQDKENWEVSLI